MKMVGPFVAWTILFGVGMLFKYTAFQNHAVWFDIAPEATLWATGIFFTTAVADAALSRAKFLARYKRKTDGLGYEISYDVTLPEGSCVVVQSTIVSKKPGGNRLTYSLGLSGGTSIRLCAPFG